MAEFADGSRKMKYRQYGRAGIDVSEIGFGGHREGFETSGGLARTTRYYVPAEQRARVVARALDRGVTYFDTTYGCELASLGESLRNIGRRDGLFVSAMRVDFFHNFLHENRKHDIRAYTRNEVEARLREFGFDHVDQFMMGALEQGDPLAHPRTLLEDAFDELEKMISEGKLRFVGFSCHEPDYAARLLDVYPRFDAVMVPYSFGNRQAEGDLARSVQKTRCAWIAMKNLVWRAYGVPVTVLRNLQPAGSSVSYDPGAPIGRLALHWILQNPLLTTCVPAMNSTEAVEEDCSAPGCGGLSDEEIETLRQYEAAADTDRHALLALGGLHESNSRILACALGLATQCLGLSDLPPVQIDWSGPTAEDEARAAAQNALELARKDARWKGMLEGE